MYENYLTYVKMYILFKILPRKRKTSFRLTPLSSFYFFKTRRTQEMEEGAVELQLCENLTLAL